MGSGQPIAARVYVSADRRVHQTAKFRAQQRYDLILQRSGELAGSSHPGHVLISNATFFFFFFTRNTRSCFLPHPPPLSRAPTSDIEKPRFQSLCAGERQFFSFRVYSSASIPHPKRVPFAIRRRRYYNVYDPVRSHRVVLCASGRFALFARNTRRESARVCL